MTRWYTDDSLVCPTSITILHSLGPEQARSSSKDHRKIQLMRDYVPNTTQIDALPRPERKATADLNLQAHERPLELKHKKQNLEFAQAPNKGDHEKRIGGNYSPQNHLDLKQQH